MEAAAAFEVALRATSDATRRDASYGQSLAYLRTGLIDEAAVAATKAPQDSRRASELQSTILAERALGAFEKGHYGAALMALDQRAQIAPERIDLMVLRGYAYMNIGRYDDARRVLEAAAGTGSCEALRALAVLRDQGRRLGKRQLLSSTKIGFMEALRALVLTDLQLRELQEAASFCRTQRRV